MFAYDRETPIIPTWTGAFGRRFSPATLERSRVPRRLFRVQRVLQSPDRSIHLLSCSTDNGPMVQQALFHRANGAR